MANERRIFRSSALALLAITCFPHGVEAVESLSNRLRVITYNVQFLPEPVSDRNERSDPEYRAARIAELASRFDIVALQETFHDTHRAQITAGIDKNWPGKLQLVASPTPKGFYASGGCLIASRMPIASRHSTVFTNYSKPADYGLRADGYAAKGVLHARILRDDFVDVFATHLEARADDLRPLQYAEIATFVKQQSSANHPILFMGDLNTRGAAEFRSDPKSQYSQLMRQLASVRPGLEWIDLWPHLHKSSLGGTTEQESSDVGKRIDYIMLSNPAPPHPQLVPISVEVKLFQDEKVTALSDHNAIAAELEWHTSTASHALSQSLLAAGHSKEELRKYVAARIPAVEIPSSKQDWLEAASRLREQVLDKVVFRGEAAPWRDAETRVEWFDTLEDGNGYRIKKFRYEALPGFWIPALLYEPEQLTNKMPVMINPNGHHRGGKAMPYKQRRCINLARRGILAYNLEFIDMGQLRNQGNKHNKLVQLDLCGTSGVAPFYLALKRGLDVALSHKHADPRRVGIAGLSGGGWQSIFLAALDTRITLANPVAGYCGLLARVEGDNNIGDAEQIPADLCSIADYTHLTAMVAPRPLLLTFNAKDDCCFVPDVVLEPLETVGRDIYGLCGATDNFQTHINHDPGTHNFDQDNREALYRLLHRHMLTSDTNLRPVEMSVDDSQIKTAEELAVPMPKENFTLHELASKISQSLPSIAAPSNHDPLTVSDGSESRRLLKRIIHQPEYEVKAERVKRIDRDGVAISHWRLKLGTDWTLPAVEFRPADASETYIVVSDGGKQSITAEIEPLLADGTRVIVVDLLGFGEADPGRDHDNKDDVMLLLIATVGERPLGIQAEQLSAVARWAIDDSIEKAPTVMAVGPRCSMISLVAAASDPNITSGLKLKRAWRSLREVIQLDLMAEDAPEQFCFGLLKHFDVPQLVALIHPRPVVFGASNIIEE